MVWRSLVLLLLMNLAIVAPCHADDSSSWDSRYIRNLISASKCKEAAEEISQRLPAGKPEIQLLAGRMYQTGTCFPMDREKAAQNYQKAALNGLSEEALPRLVWIYALDYGDPAAALWWAAQRPAMIPKECLPAADPQKEGRAFVEELRAWSSIRLKACTYHVGVLFALKDSIGDRLALSASDGLPVEVTIDLPSRSIEWYSTIDKAAFVSRIAQETGKIDVTTRPANDDPFLNSLWVTGLDTLQRFDPPPAGAPTWKTKVTLNIERPARTPHMMQFITVSPN